VRAARGWWRVRVGATGGACVRRAEARGGAGGRRRRPERRGTTPHPLYFPLLPWHRQ